MRLTKADETPGFFGATTKATIYVDGTLIADPSALTMAATVVRVAETVPREMLQKRTPAQVTAGTKAGLARIAEIDELLNATVADDPLAEVVNSADPVATWRKLPLADRRVLLDRLCTVTILPAGRRGQGFDRSTVRVEEKHTLGKPTL